jgi:hypothetical protein
MVRWLFQFFDFCCVLCDNFAKHSNVRFVSCVPSKAAAGLGLVSK